MFEITVITYSEIFAIFTGAGLVGCAGAFFDEKAYLPLLAGGSALSGSLWVVLKLLGV